MQFQSIAERTLGKGIDSRSSENAIPEGYSADLLNLTTINNRLAKRKGYESYGGCFPLRVSRVDYTASTDAIKLSFDGIVDLSTKRSTPIVVYGRTNINSSGGDFTTTDNGEYYATITPNTKESLTSPSGTVTKTSAERPVSDSVFITGLAESTSQTKTDNEVIFPDAIQLNQTSADLDIDYTVGSSTEAYVYYKGKTAVAGSVYTTDTLTLDGNGDASITAATHSLDNFSISAYFYEDSGTEWLRVFPDSLTVNSSTGQVDVSFSGLASTDVRAVLTAIPSTQTFTRAVAGATTDSFTVSGNNSPFIFMTIYQISGSTLTEVLPNSIVYDEDTDTHTVEFVNGGPAAQFEIYYEYGEIAANSLTVTSTATITGDASDTNPQMTVWGLCHEAGIYGGTKTAREGWVTHLDSYRRPAEARLVGGLGGVFYKHATRSELDADYKLTIKYPYLRARHTTSDRVIGPGFQTTSGTKRSSGSVQTDDCNASGQLPVTTIAYNSGTGYVDYTLSATANTIYSGTGAGTTTIGNVIVADRHQLTFSDCGNSRFNGTFEVKAVASATDTITVSVSIPSVDSSIWDESSVGGLAAFSSDKLSLTATPTFANGDTLTDGTNSWTCLSIDTNLAYISGTSSFVTVADSERVTGSRTSKLIQVRDNLGNLDTTNLVGGDAVTVTGEDGTYSINYINTAASESVTLTDDGSALTVSAVVDTSGFAPGQLIRLTNAGDYSGEHTILTIPSSTSFTVASVASGSGSGTLVGKTIEIDKAIVWTDERDNGDSIDVTARWIPIEAPDDSWELTENTYTYYYNSGTVSNKPFVRSTIVNDNMYFTNGTDDVYKFDGTSVYRAGLFRWQSQAFVTEDTNGGTITYSGTTTPSGTVTVNGNVFELTTAAAAQLFSVGNRIEHSNDNERYTITKIEVDETAGTSAITVDKIITGSTATATLSRVQVYSYYYRLNAINTNNSVVASAATGSEDIKVELTASAGIRHRIIGFPAMGNYNYDNIELEIYRSQADDTTEYRRIAAIPTEFDNGTGYVEFIDTLNDEDWARQPLDTVSSALLGAELGTTWQGPQRAKYITSTGNRLVLGNIKSYPRMSIFVTPEIDEVEETDLRDLIWEFKRTNNTASGTTDMINNVSYQFRTTADEVDITSRLIDLTVAAGDVTTGVGTSNVNAVAHGFVTGDRVQVSTSNTLPAPLVVSTDYYIIKIDDDNFQVASSFANAVAGTEIDFTSNGVGNHTFSPLPNIVNNSGTSFTINQPAHGLSAGDWIYAYHSAISAAHRIEYSGWWMINSATTDTFTIKHSHSAALTPTLEDVDKYITAASPEDVPVLIDFDGNRDYISGNTSVPRFDAISRFSQAINASMRKVDTSVTAMNDFAPWLIADSGGEFAAGQIVVTQPMYDSQLASGEAFELVVPNYSNMYIFVNNLEVTASSEVQAIELTYPSRLLISYPNYPELFDAPLAVSPSESDSVIDVNSADGQEITGMIPFFGDSAFGSAQKSGVLVVFKANSVYLVDVDQKGQGAQLGAANPVQKLNSRGLGCTAPDSIAQVENGVVFANESGMYMVNRQLEVEYLGRPMSRNWNRVNKNQLALCKGHHYAQENQYKLSVPIGDSAINTSEVFVFDHADEQEGQRGSWFRYDNHQATWWANLDEDAFFSTTNGKVQRVRNNGTATDFRDENAAINAVATLRANNFGASSVRKLITKLFVELRNEFPSDNTLVQWAKDLSSDFNSLATPDIDSVDADVVTIRYDLKRSRCVYLQVKISNNAVDEPLEIVGVGYRVGALSAQGTSEAGDI